MLTDVLFKVLSPTARRLIVMLVTAAVVALNKKFGLDLDAAQIAAIVSLSSIYIAQSAARQGRAPSAAEALKLAEKAVQDAQAGK